MGLWMWTISTASRWTASPRSATRSRVSFATVASASEGPRWRRCANLRWQRGRSTSWCGHRSARSASCSRPATGCARRRTPSWHGRGDATSLRAAVERERLAVESLIGSAGGLLSSDGQELSPTIIDRIADTLHAAALEDDARALLRGGRLERELRHVGLGMAAGGVTPATAPAPRAARSSAPRTAGEPAKKGAAEQSAADRRATERAVRERAQAEAQARALEREARRRLERAERGAELAHERRDRAAQALEAAEAELTDAEDELREAKARLSELRQG